MMMRMVQGEQDNNNYTPDANGCISYDAGTTDEACRNNGDKFDGHNNSYKCTGGEYDYNCCADTDEFESNVQDSGQCRKQYLEEDNSGCVQDDNATSDRNCYDSDRHSGFNFSFECSQGWAGKACCNKSDQQLSNVQNMGQCRRYNDPSKSNTEDMEELSVSDGGLEGEAAAVESNDGALISVDESSSTVLLVASSAVTAMVGGGIVVAWL